MSITGPAINLTSFLSTPPCPFNLDQNRRDSMLRTTVQDREFLSTLGAHAQRGLQYLVCRSVRPRPSVFPSVTTTTHNEMAKKRYKWVQRYTCFIFNMAIFVKVPRSKFMAWKPSEQANMLIRFTSTGPACSVYLEGTTSHNEGRVLTTTCYLLL